MAIGDVSASGGIANNVQQDRVSATLRRGSSGLDASVQALLGASFKFLGSETEMADVYDNRAMATEGVDLDAKFLQYQQDRANDYTTLARDRSANPLGMTNDFNTQLAKSEEAFLQQVPARFRSEYEAKLKGDRANRVGSAFRAELELLDNADTVSLGNSLNTLGSGLKGKTVSLEDASASWDEMVDKSALPAMTKESLKRDGKATLEGLDFGTQVETAGRGFGSVNANPNGADVAAAGLVPQQRAVLNSIASVESPGYNVWNGGKTFEGYADHPAATMAKPGMSTAAGRYQYLLSTWRAATKSYEQATGIKVPDFSPEWQDRVTLHWMEVQFNKWNGEGLNFQQVLMSGDPEQIVKIRRVLGNPKVKGDPNSVEWQGLGDAFMGGQAEGDRKFLEVFTGEKGIAGGGTGHANVPNVWTDPKYANIPLDKKMSYSNAAWAANEQANLDDANRRKQESAEFQDRVFAQGYSTGDLDGMASLQKSPYWNADSEVKYREGVDKFWTKETSIGTVGTKLETGEGITKQDAKGFAQWFGDQAFQGIASGAQASYDKMKYAVTRAGQMPEGSVDAFRAAMASPEAGKKALEFLAQINETDPSILVKSGFSEKDVADAVTYQRLAGRGDPQKALADLQLMKDRAANMDPTKLRNSAQKYFEENIDTSSILKMFDPWGLGNKPDSKLNPMLETQLSFDTQSAFIDGYMMYADPEAAMAYAESYVKKTYGVTYLRGATQVAGGGDPLEILSPILMKYPPENSYTPGDGEFNHIYKALDEFVINNYGRQNGKFRQGSSRLISDDVTEQQVRNGEPPTYIVVAQGEYGEAIAVPGRFGGEYLNEQAASITAKANERNSVMGKYGASSNQVRQAEVDIWKASTPEEKAKAEENLAKAKAVNEADRSVAIDTNWLSARWHDVVDPLLAKPLDYGPGSKATTGLPADGNWGIEDSLAPKTPEGKVAAHIKDLLKVTPDTQDFRTRLSSLTTNIIRTQRDAEGNKYNEPRAKRKALVEILAKELQITPDMAEKALEMLNTGILK